MQISPRYEGEPIVTVDVAPPVIVEPFLRQRRRLLDTLAALDDDQWHAPSRCDGWSAQDVVTHLVSTDDYWSASLAGGLAGEPTRYLQGFDPKASPAALVEAAGSVAPAETHASFADATSKLCDAVEALDDHGLTVLAEAPPGHIAVHAVLHHALWDCWVHERDITVPLGLDTTEEDDEVLACLRYAVALSPAFALANGHGGRGVLGAEVTDPEATVYAEIDGSVVVRAGAVPEGAAVLRGRAVDVLEHLSVRSPLVHDLDPADEWMLGGLSEVFETAT